MLNNIICICDLEKSKVNIHSLLDDLLVDKVILFDEITKENLIDYKMILFILEATNIGNKFFIDNIIDILEKRKNTRSIHFAIDGIENLSKREIIKLQIELEKSIDKFIENPKISFISTKLASVNKKYKLGVTTIDNIRKDKSIVFEDSDGFSVTSSQIQEEHVYNFWKISNMQTLIDSINEDIKNLEHIDITKIHIGVFGNKNSGKTSLIGILNSLYEDIEFSEFNDKKDINLSIIDVLLIVLTNNHDDNKKLLNDIEYDFFETKKLVILNKTDEFMYQKQTIDDFKNTAREYVKEILNTDVIFISSYYLKKWIELNEDIILTEDVLNDNDIILYDKYSLPIVKFNSNDEFLNIFSKQNYTKELYEIGEILCLNHLQKKNKEH